VHLDRTQTFIDEGGVMIDHTGIGVADVGRSAKFYDAALAALGMRRVRQMPDDVGTDGIGYGFDYPVFWIDRDIIHIPSGSTLPSPRGAGRRSMASTLPPSKQAGPRTGRLACAGRATTPRSCSIRMGTTSRRCFAASQGWYQSGERTIARIAPCW
jgi:catechol 2,3-dioxygenase-like lactoylglutathione lyase family enzyme